MRYNAIDKIKKIGCSPFITVIGRGGAGERNCISTAKTDSLAPD